MGKRIGLAVVILIALALLIQLVPYGRNHTNPPVAQEPNWDSPQTRAVAQRACFDCHSNETVWPWYSNIAPVSWLVMRDTEQGRDKLNFSDWANTSVRPSKVIEVIKEGKMPPGKYLLLHPEARLTADEKAVLIGGLETTLR